MFRATRDLNKATEIKEFQKLLVGTIFKFMNRLKLLVVCVWVGYRCVFILFVTIAYCIKCLFFYDISTIQRWSYLIVFPIMHNRYSLKAKYQ